MKEAAQPQVAVVQTPLGLTEQNSHSDNLETIAIVMAFAILVVVVLVGWFSCKYLFGTKSSPTSVDPTDHAGLF